MTGKPALKASGTVHLIRAMATGAGVSLAVIIIACMLCALGMGKQLLPETAAPICTGIICGIGTITGCMLGQKAAGIARLPVSLGTAGLLLIAMAAIRGILHSGSAASWLHFPVVAVCAVISALIGAGRAR